MPGAAARGWAKRLAASALVVAAFGCGGNDGKLKVTGLDPRSGDAMGGQIVVISGQAFMNPTRTAKVYFGDQQGNVIRFRSDGEIIVEAPAGQAGTSVDVLVVFEPGGEITIPKGFTFKEKKGINPEDLK